jgi:very-short-patch-repair endonuclease
VRSRLQAYVSECLSKSLTGCEIIEDAWPDWLQQLTGRRLQLDFYLPAMRVAIEVQGEQHYRLVHHWHPTQAHFEDMQRRDDLKRQACAYMGVQLLTIDDRTDVIQVVERLAQLWNNRTDYRSPITEEARRRQRIRSKSRHYYMVHAHDRSRHFVVSRVFFEELVSMNRVKRLKRNVAILLPEYQMSRNKRLGGFELKRRVPVDQEESAYPAPQAKRKYKELAEAARSLCR